MDNVSFVLIYKHDSQDRFYNINIVYNYIRLIFPSCEIITSEQGEYQTLNGLGDKYIFNRDTSKYFNRSRCINNGIKIARHNAIFINDADMITSKKNYIKSMNYYINGYEFITCHNNITLSVPKTLDRSKLSFLYWDYEKEYGFNRERDDSELSGINLINRKSFCKYGLYNENFIGWGQEDREVIIRLKTLGAKIITKIDGEYLLHLDHDKIIWGFDTPVYNSNVEERKRIEDMNYKNLKKELKLWNWI